MNKTNELNTQALKLDNFRNIEKIGLKAIVQDPKTWDQVNQTIDKIFRQKDQDGKDLFESNRKLWDKVADFNHDFSILKELKTMFENKTLDRIYTQYLSNRSDYNGNHGQITMSYPYMEEASKQLRISQIRLHCLGVKETKNGFVYLRHGGNYSFEHDVVSSLNYFLFGNSEGFKQESL